MRFEFGVLGDVLSLVVSYPIRVNAKSCGSSF
jgi:hypothetical protein